jgi:hypothetical protein
MKREFVAYGAGVGSTALLYLKKPLIRTGDIEVVYSDHGCDLPETREYIRTISQALDIDITTLPAGNLYDYCWQKRLLPSIHWRWCTDKFKIRPMKKYVDGDIPMIGITLDERRRASDFRFGGKSSFPLLEKHITRNQAEDMIESEKPCKSGCFFCPFQGKEQWRQLFAHHKDLFEMAIRLEEHARERNPKIYLYNGLLRNLKREFQTQATLEKWE